MRNDSHTFPLQQEHTARPFCGVVVVYRCPPGCVLAPELQALVGNHTVQYCRILYPKGKKNTKKLAIRGLQMSQLASLYTLLEIYVRKTLTDLIGSSWVVLRWPEEIDANLWL